MAAGAAEFYQQVTVLLALATLTYFFSKRFHQPTIIGEIAIGVLIGPSVLGFLGIFQFDPALINTFASLGAIFLLFLIGLESNFRSLYTRENFLVALGGVLFPLLLGFATAFFLVPDTSVPATATRFILSMFVGAALTATSTAIAAAVLLDLGLMKERVAQTILGAAVVDDILGLLVLSLVVGMSHGSLDAVGLAVLMGTAVAFIVVGILVGIRFFNPIVVRIQIAGMKLGLKHGGFIIAMAIAFLYAFVAEIIGLSAIVGAFLAGTMFASTPLKDDFTEGAGYLGAVFTPVFFLSLGLQVNLEAVYRAPGLYLFAIALTGAAVVTKVVGCAVPARLQRMTKHESLAVGWGMTPRGEVGLIVALTALTAGIIAADLFSVVVLVIILVSVLPAPFFRRALVAVRAERAPPAAETAEPGT